MKPFNLAEERIAERSYCRQVVNRRLKMMAIFVILTVLVCAASFACKIGVAGKANALKMQLADVQERCIKIKQGMGELKTKSSQRTWQADLTKSSCKWLDILDSILQRVPQDAWLERVENSTQSESLTIDGHAASFESLSQFISRLRDIKEFSEVRISGTTVNVDKKGGAILDFSVQVKLNGPAGTPVAVPPLATPAPAAPEAG